MGHLMLCCMSYARLRQKKARTRSLRCGLHEILEVNIRVFPAKVLPKSPIRLRTRLAVMGFPTADLARMAVDFASEATNAKAELHTPIPNPVVELHPTTPANDFHRGVHNPA